MHQVHPTIRTMTWQEAQEYGYVNMGQMMDYNCISYRISAGTSDEVHTFKSGVTLYVLTINTRLDSVGLDFYMPNEQDPMDSIFLQGDYAISECIGNDWRSLPLVDLATRLIQLFA